MIGAGSIRLNRIAALVRFIGRGSQPGGFIAGRAWTRRDQGGRGSLDHEGAKASEFTKREVVRAFSVPFALRVLRYSSWFRDPIALLFLRALRSVARNRGPSEGGLWVGGKRCLPALAARRNRFYTWPRPETSPTTMVLKEQRS